MEFKIDDVIHFNEKMGIVKYVGAVDSKNGVYVGIKLNSEDGTNDGTFNGVKYFECGGRRCGVFVEVSYLREQLSKISRNRSSDTVSGVLEFANIESVDNKFIKYSRDDVNMGQFNLDCNDDYKQCRESNLEEIKFENQKLKDKLRIYKNNVRNITEITKEFVEKNKEIVKCLDNLNKELPFLTLKYKNIDTKKLKLIELIESILYKMENDESINEEYDEFNRYIKNNRYK